MKVLCCLLLASLAACSTPSAPATSPTAAPVPPTAAATARPVAPAPATFLFDVPALLAQGLDQLMQQLGPASGKDTPNESIDELERTYLKHGQKLVITYNTQTRQTESFFLPAPGPTETTRTCRQLLRAGNLRLDDPTY